MVKLSSRGCLLQLFVTWRKEITDFLLYDNLFKTRPENSSVKLTNDEALNLQKIIHLLFAVRSIFIQHSENKKLVSRPVNLENSIKCLLYSWQWSLPCWWLWYFWSAFVMANKQLCHVLKVSTVSKWFCSRWQNSSLHVYCILAQSEREFCPNLSHQLMSFEPELSTVGGTMNMRAGEMSSNLDLSQKSCKKPFIYNSSTAG